MSLYRSLTDQDRKSCIEAYWEVVRSYHDAVFDGCTIPERGKKYMLTSKTQALLPDNVTATELETDADDLEKELTPFTTVTFKLDGDGRIFMSLHTIESLKLNERFPAIPVEHAKRIGANTGDFPLSSNAWRALKAENTPNPNTSVCTAMQDEVVKETRDENNNEVKEKIPFFIYYQKRNQ